MTTTGQLALTGDVVRLDPLTHADVGSLLQTANEDRSSYAFTWVRRAGRDW